SHIRRRRQHPSKARRSYLMRHTVIPALALVATALVAFASGEPLKLASAHATTCSAYPNQAAAQRAADTVDADRDGVYCESLPCPCLKPGDSGGSGGGSDEPAAEPKAPSCQKPTGVQSISFSATKYPKIKAHAERAIAKGWPKVLVLNRPGADARRDRLLQ